MAYDDVRWRDMRALDLSDQVEILPTLRFNMATIWPEPNGLPADYDAEILLTAAMNPGLGIRTLHDRGITGAGVNVAIIDQGTYETHPEYEGKIVAYHDLAAGHRGSMHASAVTSLLVGSLCGTAPEANVFYAACRDVVYEEDYVKALTWIIIQNQSLPDAEKIRVVSVSAAPGIAGIPLTNRNRLRKWDQVCHNATAAGILVLDCTDENGFIGSCGLDSDYPEDVNMCTPGFPGLEPVFDANDVLVPSSPRTTAEQYDSDDMGAQYCGRGGLSWSIPYAAGVLALGWQVCPDLTAEDMKTLLFATAYVNEAGARIIDPLSFIQALEEPDHPIGTQH